MTGGPLYVRPARSFCNDILTSRTRYGYGNRMGRPDPSRFEVHKSLRDIIKQATKRVQADYKGSLTGTELRLLVAVYVRRASDLLCDSETVFKEKDGVLCLGKMEF